MRMPVLTTALRVRKVLHHLQGLKLPFPMTPGELGLGFAASLVALLLLARGERASMGQLALILLLVVGIVVLLRSKPVDGKSTPQLMVTLLRWIGSPARMIGDRPDTERDQRIMVTAFVRGEVGEDLSSWVPWLDVLAIPGLVEADPQEIKEEGRGPRLVGRGRAGDGCEQRQRSSQRTCRDRGERWRSLT